MDSFAKFLVGLLMVCFVLLAITFIADTGQDGRSTDALLLNTQAVTGLADAQTGMAKAINGLGEEVGGLSQRLDGMDTRLETIERTVDKIQYGQQLTAPLRQSPIVVTR
jgi:hypothetical protein